MGDLQKLTILWDGKQFEIKVQREFTVGLLKKLVYDQTGVKPFLQTFLNLESKEAIIDDESKLHQLILTNESVVVMVKVQEQPNFTRIPRAATKTRTTVSCSKLPISKTNQSKGKNLLVLDIDLTIFDSTPEGQICGRRAARPYLHYFLTSVAKHYDIAIWSATSMKYIEPKLKWLGITDNPNYKIRFCLDRYRMSLVQLSGDHVIAVKALSTIWNRYREYNKKRTIIYDDQPINFYFNEANGLPVSPYSYTNYGKDKELFYLTDYLKRIANFYDLSLLIHRKWQIN